MTATVLRRLERAEALARSLYARTDRAAVWSADPVTFAREALALEPDDWQRRTLRWTGRRLALLCARQTGKSTTSAVLALHQALYRAGSLTLLVSPWLRQSAELFRKVVELLDRLDERPALVEDNRLSLTLASRSRVVSLPSSEATIRGYSKVDLLIEDEAARVDDPLYHATRLMLAVSNGRHILMSTPWGRRGHFFEVWQDGGPGWERIRITADQCPRITPAFLAEERASLPPWVYAAEWECEFTDNELSAFDSALIAAALDSTVTPLWEVA
jgi:terminase large subunit-like protein